ncbi:MAG: protein-disulfide reductase DsbD [Calditrichia bacterium]
MNKAVILFLLLSLAILLQAQNSDEILSVKVISSVEALKPGSSHPIAVQLQVKAPFHINAAEPSEDYLIPTTITFQPPEGITIGEIRYPDPELKQFAFSENPLAVHEGTIDIFTTLSISPEFSADELVLEGVAGYQACDDHTCQAPAEVRFSETFPVLKEGEEVVPVHQELFSRTEEIQLEPENRIPESDNDNLAATVQEKGLLLTFLLVFVAGLALNLTPCVYPLIPITISYFGGQAEGKKGSLLVHSLIYVLGMAITYSILGVFAALTGNLFGAALQNPVVLAIIAAILIGLALSMFDLYEIRVPVFLSNFAGGGRQGFFGTFFMGLTVGIVAAPCIGPFVLALLTYVGEQGSVLLGFWLFFVLALGLGVPFIFLAMFSGSISKMPRSGSWMIWVRSIFGFILIAMAIYFLQPLFPNALYYNLSLAFVMLIGGIYMAWIEPTPATGKIFPVIRNIIGIIFFVLALFLTVNGIQGYVQKTLAAGGTVQQSSENDISWNKYDEELLQTASRAGQPVMIDFYADWCIPCKEMDQLTFSHPEIIETSRDFMMLKVDLTTDKDPLAKSLKEKYKIKGVPTFVFLNRDGEEIPDLRVVGFRSKEDFLPHMKTALQ